MTRATSIPKARAAGIPKARAAGIPKARAAGIPKARAAGIPEASRTLKVAVVGLGYWGPNLVRNLHELPRVARVWACDLRPDRLKAITRRFPATKPTTSYEDLLADPSIDAVLIATPISTHHRIAAAALEAGKHVMVEKPLAASASEAVSLIELAENRNLVLMPGHTFLYSPSVAMIQSLIQSGELGEVYFISTSRVNLGLHQSDVSVAWDLGPHDFSILCHWLNETPVRVSALARSCIIPGIPDVAFIDLEYASGTVAHVELSWLAPSKLRRTTIVGSRKMVVYDDTSAEPVRVFDSGAALPDPTTFGEFRLTYHTGDVLSPHVEAAEPIYRELEDFCAAILDHTIPRSSAQLGLDVVRTIEAVDASLACGGARVDFDPASADTTTSAGAEVDSAFAAVSTSTRVDVDPSSAAVSTSTPVDVEPALADATTDAVVDVDVEPTSASSGAGACVNIEPTIADPRA